MKNIKRRSISMILAATLCFGMTFSSVYADDEIQEIYEEKMAVEEIIEEKNEAELSKQVEQFEKIEKIEKVEKKMPVLEESVLKEINKMPAVEELKMEMPAEELKEELKAEEKEAPVEEEKIAEVQTTPVELMDVAEKKESVEKIEKIADLMPAEMVKEAVEKIPAELIMDKLEEAVLEEVAEEVEDIEEVEEEPAFVSDAVTMTVTGNLTVYLQNPDQTTQLTAVNKNESKKTADDQEIIWSSSNESIATVDQNGLVTIVTDKANKTVKITATAANVEGLSVTKTVWTRNADEKIICMNMTSPTNSYMEGVPVQFTAGFTNEFAIKALDLDIEAIWNVENVDGEATISADGLLTPVKAGKVKVILSNNINTNTHTKTITIKAPILVNKLTMNPTSATLTIKDDKAPTKALKVSVSPTNATNKAVTWKSSDETVATVDANGLVTAVGEGTAIITAASESDPSVTATSQINVIDLNNKEYNVTVKHYFTKTFVVESNYNGIPEPAKLVRTDNKTVKHGELVDAGDYAFAGPIQYPYNFEYEGQKYMLSGSYVAADGVYGDAPFEAKSDIDIIYTYSAIATYTVTYNFLDVETKAPVRDSASRSYEIMLGYVDQPYNFTKTVNANNTLDGYTFVRVEGDVEGIFNEANANKEINLYFEKVQPVVEEEPVVEEPIIEEPTKEPEIEEPIIEEPVVEQPEEIEEPEVPQAEPEVEEPTHKTRKTEKEDPIEETTSEETVEIAEEISDEETPLSDFEEEEEEEIIADEDAPMAAFEMEAVEDTDIAEEPVLVNSPLTGDERHTAAWAGLSLASLLGILFLERKKRMAEE